MYPETYRYTKEHEWILVEGDAATVGLTFYAQKEMGDIVYVDLPKPGDPVAQAKAMGSVESVKAVVDIYAPASGEVTAVNEDLSSTPEKLNEDPHGEAWLVKIRLADPKEVEGLMTSAEYQQYLEKPEPEA